MKRRKQEAEAEVLARFESRTLLGMKREDGRIETL